MKHEFAKLGVEFQTHLEMVGSGIMDIYIVVYVISHTNYSNGTPKNITTFNSKYPFGF